MRPPKRKFRPSTAPSLHARVEWRPTQYQSPCARLKVVNGDAFAVVSNLASGSIDAVVTDPPYCSGAATFKGVQADPKKKYSGSNKKWVWPTFANDAKSTHAWRLWLTTLMTETHRALKPGGYAMMFSDWRRLSDAQAVLEGAGFLWRGIVTWDKGTANRAPHTGYFRHQAEYVLWGTKGPCLKRKGGPFPGVYQHRGERPGIKLHMTGKPVDLMTDLLAPLPDDALIFDPFAGSASTGVAAYQTGHRFLGVELTDEYFGHCRGSPPRPHQAALCDLTARPLQPSCAHPAAPPQPFP